MIVAPHPPDEQRRIAALHNLGILDTPREDRFDRITRTATKVFGVPVALVSLIDVNRQWMKSCIGMELGETSRAVSFCSHAILTSDPLVIPDARADARFADNPLVTGPPHVVFYAGQPLHTLDGSRVGTLCLIDHEPRTLEHEDLATLRDLAAWAQTELNAEALDEALGAQRRLEDLRQRYESILESAGDGILMLDRRGRVTFANPAARRLFRTDDLDGHSLHEMFHNRHHDGTPYAWQDCPTAATLLEGEGRRVLDEEYLRADGSFFPVEYFSAPVYEDGEIAGAVLTISDVSERREIERLKDEFVSLVSHELRTPLTSIRGSLGLLDGGVMGELPAEAADLVEMAVTSTDRLIRLINDILDLERISAGRAVLEYEVTQPSALVDGAVNAVYPGGGTPTVSINADGVVECDPDRVVQALTNLLGNAVKFSPPGGAVDVDVQVGEGDVVFTVADRGRGIPAENLDTIFNRFEQVQAGDARTKGGTGLGLAITRAIAEQHGGRVWAEQREGGGTAFHLAIPRCRQVPA